MTFRFGPNPPTAAEAWALLRPLLPADFQLCAIYSGTGLQQLGQSSEWMFIGRLGSAGLAADLSCDLDDADQEWIGKLILRELPAPVALPITLPFLDSSDALTRGLAMLGRPWEELDDRTNLSAQHDYWTLQTDVSAKIPF